MTAITQDELRERIVTCLREAKKPVTYKRLATLTKTTDEAFRAALDQAIAEAKAHRWPDYRRSQYFWHISPDEKARESVLAVFAAQALSKTEVSKAAARHLPGFSAKRVESHVGTLVAERQLQFVPAFASRSKLLVRTGDGEAYFAAARAFVEKKIREAGFDPGAFFAAKSPAHVDAAALILEAVRTLEPVRGVPVSTLRLRNHLPNVPKRDFDLGALELRKKQDVFLSQHADPFNLSPEDKDLLVDGQDGTYYVAIAIR